MGLGFTEGFTGAQDRRLTRQRNDILDRQVGIAEKAQLVNMAQERVNATFKAINDLFVAGQSTGQDMTKTITAGREMLAGLRDIAPAAGIDPRVLQARFDAIIGQPSARERAEQEAIAAAMKKLAEQRAVNIAGLEEIEGKTETISKLSGASATEALQGQNLLNKPPKPSFQNFLFPDGSTKSFDLSTEEGITKAREAVGNGATEFGATVQASTAADLLTGGGKRRVPEVRKALRQLMGDIGEVDETLRVFAETPEAGGIIGGLIEKVGGVVQQLPGGGAALDFVGVDPAEVKAVRTQARATVSRLLTTITQETSRFTDEERRIAKEVLSALSPDASFEQIRAAGNTILGMMNRSKARLVQELIDASNADVSTPEGRDTIFNLLKKNGFNDTESADFIIDRMAQ